MLAWSPPGLTRIMLSAAHQDGSVKHATVAPSKIHGRENITIATWNTRTVTAARKLHMKWTGTEGTYHITHLHQKSL